MATTKGGAMSPQAEHERRWEAFDSTVIGARVKALREALAIGHPGMTGQRAAHLFL